MSYNVYTNSDNLERKQKEQTEVLEDAILLMGGTAAVIATASNVTNKNETVKNLVASLPGANRYRAKYEEARAYYTAKGSSAVDLKDMYDNQSFGRSMLSILSSAEELSPIGILKTLQVSNLLEPIVKTTAKGDKDIFIKGSAIEAYEDLYRKQFSKNGKQLSTMNIEEGFVLRSGNLYPRMPDGSINVEDPWLKNAKIVTSHVKMGDRISPNRVLQKYANIQGTSLPHNAFDLEQTVVIGNNSKARLASDWARSYIRQGLEIGYKTMDNPIGGLEDLLKATGIDNTPFAETEVFKKIRDKLNLELGTNGQYNLSTRESLGIMSKNIAVKSAALYLGYQGINQVLDKVTNENSIWHDGLLSGAASLYADTRVSMAKVFADPFQKYKEEQEAAAQGSTNLTTLAGFPIAGAVLGASSSYYKRLYNSGKFGIEAASNISETETADTLLNKLGFSKKTPFKNNAIKGALVGAAFALPFLPGALIGESSEELKKEFTGEKEVANRANRWWLAGGNRYEGDHIKNYQAGWVARTLANTKNEALYDGDTQKRLDYDPIYSPLKYLRNPYKYEEDTQDERPYPVWGMEVTYGSFLGKLFQSTLGEIIKPTKLSPEFEKITEEGGTGGEGSGRSEGAVAIKNGNGKYSVKIDARRQDANLVDSGMMLAEDDASVNSITQPLKKAYSALGDFVGLKGFIGNTFLDKIGIDLENSDRQLSRSGEGDTAAKTIKDLNMGDIGGLGEFQRRMVPTSASSKQDTINPLHNKAAPSWLPKDESQYYIDFSKGDYWTKVANAETRLPGKGYVALNKELKDIDPENYPLVHQYKILSDVATGSSEQISMRKNILSKVASGDIVGKDRDLFYETLEKEQNKSVKREFNEYLTEEEKANLSGAGKVLNKLWEFGAHKAETPLEPLTPFRPGSKFIHARSSIEDYNMTMLQGPDTGIWTNPYEHFFRVSWNRSKDTLVPGVNKPIEASERDNVEEYFDKLEYIKARKNNDSNAALKTTIGRTFAGISDKSDMNKFKRSLSKDQQLYVESFSKETNPENREKILAMLPKDVGSAYVDIWNNLRVVENAKKEGKDVDVELKKEYKENTKKIAEVYNLKPKEDSAKTIIKNEDLDTRLRAADIEAENFVESRTGMPSKEWLGWDPRLTMDDVKIRTLTVGKADIFKYGFWKPDKERNDRIVALNNEQEVSTKYADIKKKIIDTNEEQERIKRHMFEKGILAERVILTEASQNDVRIAVKQDT